MPKQTAEPPHAANELALQRRWAEGRWPAPWLRLERGGPPLRVHFAGRWNRAAGPDFRGAILLDPHGRARRGDVELHRRPGGWRSHGHHRDPAYARVLLHIVGDPGGKPAGPPVALLPPPKTAPPPIPQPPIYQPPCARVVERAGAAAVAARLRRLARDRLARKTAALRRRRAAWRARPDQDELFVAWSLARALAMPHNAELMGGALQSSWPRLETLRGELDARRGWQPGRGALGKPDGAAEALTTLLSRWGTGAAAAACLRLAEIEAPAAAEALRIPQRLGPARARQLLADAIYPAALVLGAPPDQIERRWLALPETRYLRTAALRQRLRALPQRHARTHAHAQALLDLERRWCAQAACAVCPLGRLSRETTRTTTLIPSLNLPPPA